MPRKPDLSIIGQTFNSLKVIKYTDKRNSYRRGLYECQCLLCSGTAYATKNNLIRGEVKNCGCTRHNPKKEDLIGKKFGQLTVISKTIENNSLRYICKCECGNIVNVRSQGLVSGNTKTCGHSHKGETAVVKKNYVDGTAPCKLKNTDKLRSTNTSGVTGVYWDKARNLWSAEIMFKKKKYYLGRYADKELAIQARKKAEEEIFENFLEWYEREYKNKNGDGK